MKFFRRSRDAALVGQGKSWRLALFLPLLGGFIACATGAANAQQVTQGYASDTPLQNGMIVKLKPGDSTKVQPLAQTDAASMLGVVVSAGAAPVALSSNGAVAQVFVATFGQYAVLVSNQDGAIKQGDFITISSISGVGMKADSAQTTILGKALAGFDGRTNTEGTTTLTTGSASRTLSLARIPVDISVAHNPLYQPPVPDANGVPQFLARAAQVITDKPVGAVRIYLGAAVLLLGLVVAASLLISGARSSIGAVGRNPLARPSIMRGLLQIVLVALIVVFAAVFAVYLLLKL